MQECNWVVSGDGEYVRHAITNEEGFQLARVWMEDSSSMGHWVPGCVNAGGSSQPGMLAAGSRHLDYQVLTASELCQASLLPSKIAKHVECLGKGTSSSLASFLSCNVTVRIIMHEMGFAHDKLKDLVLLAGPVPQSLREGNAEASRLLSLSISLDTLEGMLENDLTPPEVAPCLQSQD